ncbi:hypothetical protein L9F63_024757, partial [Diploptera punctata]
NRTRDIANYDVLRGNGTRDADIAGQVESLLAVHITRCKLSSCLTSNPSESALLVRHYNFLNYPKIYPGGCGDFFYK